MKPTVGRAPVVPRPLVRLYHFTSPVHLPAIERAGVLRRTESNLHPLVEHAGPDVVWFTTEAVPLLGHGLDGGVADKAAVRFTVEVPPSWVHEWAPWAQGHGIDHGWLAALVESGGGAAAARTWRVTERPVRRERWVAVEHRPEAGW